MPAFGHEDVRGLDVPVDNTSAVSSIERIRNLNSQQQYLIDRHRLAANSMLQSHPLQKLHRYEWMLFMLANLIDRTDVGMIESRCGTSFTPEAFQRLGVTCEVFGQELQSDQAPKFHVLGLVDHTHATAPNFFEDSVVSDRLDD